jgi:cysteine desulfurase
MTREIYLDNSATTRPYDEVVDYMSNISRSVYANPSSMHKKGIEAERLIKKARAVIAESLKADTREVFFTSGGTESNNLAIRGYLYANSRKGKHVLTTSAEHPSVLEVFKYLASNGYEVEYLDIDRRGEIDLDCLRKKIRKDTSLISFVLVNNETGVVQPVEEIISIKNSINRETAVHIDAVQAYGKMPVFPEKLGVDLMSFSSHKIHGPKGVGALYVSRKVKILPTVFGGGQESLLRPGTENVPGICGFGLAAETVFKGLEYNADRVSRIKNRMLKALKENFSEISINSPEGSSPYILNVSFYGIKAEVLLHHLEDRNIFVSTGSACSSRKNVHSHVLEAMGLKGFELEGAIRFSFSSFNTEEDIDETIKALRKIIPLIRFKSGGRR